MMNGSRHFINTMIASVFLFACASSPTVLDEKYHSIHVSVFDNRTLEFGVEERFTQSMINAFQRDGRLRIQSKSNADLEMDAKIEEVVIRPVAFSDIDRAVGFGMDVTLSVTVVDSQSGETIMDNVSFQGTGNFFLQNEPTRAVANDVAMKLSENILSHLLEGW